MQSIEYAIEPGLGVAEFVDVLRRSTLAERRPVDDLDRVSADAGRRRRDHRGAAPAGWSECRGP